MPQPIEPHLLRLARALRVPVSGAQLTVCQGHKNVIHISCHSIRQAGVAEGSGVELAHLGRHRVWLVFHPPADGVGAVLHHRKGKNWYHVYSVPLCRILRFLAGDNPPRFRLMGEPRVVCSKGTEVCVVWQVDPRPVEDLRALSSKYAKVKGV